MSTTILDLPALEAVAEPTPIENLATATEKLGALRYMIVMTARWESSDSVDPRRRKQMRRELAQLHLDYFNKIDEIALNHGVQAAMDAKQMVERGVKVPKNARPPMRTQVTEQAWY